MAQPISHVASEVMSRSRGLDQYVTRAEAAYSSGALTLTDLERVYAGAWLSYIRFLERSIERAFLGLLMGRFASSLAGVRPLVSMESERVARAVVNGGRSYADWLPFDQYTKPRARAFFSRGLPFTLLSTQDRAVLRRAHSIRNAIAHESAAALRHFQAECVQDLGLPPRQQRPPGYLRGQHAVDQTRIQFLMADCNGVMARLCA